MTPTELRHLRKWNKRYFSAASKLENEMSEEDHTATTDFFFLDELDNQRVYISVSVGDVWLYFWMEILIGVRDLRINHAAFLRVKPDAKVEPDGYSHRHLITPEIVRGAMNEVYPDKVPPKFLSASELQALAFQWVTDSCVKHVERELKSNS